MAKEPNMAIVPQASEQPPKTGKAPDGAMPGKTKGGKMPHEVMNDKMAKGLGC